MDRLILERNLIIKHFFFPKDISDSFSWYILSVLENLSVVIFSYVFLDTSEGYSQCLLQNIPVPSRDPYLVSSQIYWPQSFCTASQYTSQRHFRYLLLIYTECPCKSIGPNRSFFLFVYLMLMSTRTSTVLAPQLCNRFLKTKMSCNHHLKYPHTQYVSQYHSI